MDWVAGILLTGNYDAESSFKFSFVNWIEIEMEAIQPEWIINHKYIYLCDIELTYY